MFNSLSVLPSDPLLRLIESFNKDTRSQKIDVGVGMYKNEQGQLPVMACIKHAEAWLLEHEQTKAYVGALGDQHFAGQIAQRVFGEQLSASLNDRLTVMQTPGGCAALRVAADLILRSNQSATLWVSDPTWANHIPLLGNAGVMLETYPYYDQKNHSLLFDDMLAVLGGLGSKDLVLLHGSCHNPSGADLSLEQWQTIAKLAQERGFIPFVDLAYQGFGDGLEEDVAGLRVLAESLGSVLIAISCSKNFGLYRERTGAVAIISANSEQNVAVRSHLINIVRGMYSMPPSHGARVVDHILSTPELANQWQAELEQQRQRIQAMRHGLATTATALGIEQDFGFIRKEKGMFSFLGISPEHVQQLAEDYGIYMASSSRISLAGLNEGNLSYFCESLKAVLQS